MNTTKMSPEIKIDEGGTDKQGREVSTMEKDLNTMFPLYVLLVNLPFGIVTALTARAIIGMKP